MTTSLLLLCCLALLGGIVAVGAYFQKRAFNRYRERVDAARSHSKSH